jgi:hypothetical protein
METEEKYCTRCGAEIPAGRLKAIPDTLVCVKCSEEIGGEFELKVTVSGTAKAGSLKVTGQLTCSVSGNLFVQNVELLVLRRIELQTLR